MHFYKKKIPIVKIQTMSVFKQDGAPPSKFIVRNLCRPPTTTCHHHRPPPHHRHCPHHHDGHSLLKCPAFYVSHFSHIIVCALIYPPYLPVNLRHIFHPIPHDQLVQMRNNLHRAAVQLFHRIFYGGVFYGFLRKIFHGPAAMHCNEESDQGCISQRRLTTVIYNRPIFLPLCLC